MSEFEKFEKWWNSEDIGIDASSWKMIAWNGWQARSALPEVLATAHDALVLIDSWIQRGDIGGNGTDKSAQRNGMVIAYNLVYALAHGQDIEFGPHRDEHLPQRRSP